MSLDGCLVGGTIPGLRRKIRAFDLVLVDLFSSLSYPQGLEEYLSLVSAQSICVEELKKQQFDQVLAGKPNGHTHALPPVIKWHSEPFHVFCKILFKRQKGEQFQLVVICQGTALGQQKLISLAEEQIPPVLP